MRLAVIGGGPAGYGAAFEAAAAGMEVTLVESGRIGGTCLNYGCIPTKTIRASADALVMAKRMAEFGVAGCANPAIDPEVVQKRKNAVIATLAGGLEKTCFALKINYLQGEGALAGNGRIIVKGEGEAIVDCDKIIIASGSKIMELPGLPFDHQFILDSNDALALDKVPQNLVILGGGVIGCELACIFRAFGSNVAIVEGQDRLLPIPGVDSEISSLLNREMRKRKIKINTASTLRDVDVANGKVTAKIGPSPFVEQKTAQTDATPIEADMIFVTVGRSANIDRENMAANGVELDQRGWIKVDENLLTSAPGVYAAGDVLGPAHMMLAHVAAMEGLTIVNGLLGGNPVMDYKAVPSAIFTEPEIGCVGLSEAQARERYDNVICGVTQTRSLGKAQAMGELPGFFKIIANGDNGEVLGVQLAGAHATDLVAEGVLAVRGLARLEDLAHTIHAHPTLAEGMFEAARDALKNRKLK